MWGTEQQDEISNQVIAGVDGSRHYQTLVSAWRFEGQNLHMQQKKTGRRCDESKYEDQDIQCGANSTRV